MGTEPCGADSGTRSAFEREHLGQKTACFKNLQRAAVLHGAMCCCAPG